MIKKTYSAKSIVAVRVSLSYGLTAQVAFKSLPSGGSRFVTTDTSLQNALENHQKYSKLFTLSDTEEVANPVTDPKVTYYDKESNVGNVITFDRQYLTEQEKEQARRNIGAATEPAELENVLRYSEQSLNQTEQQQARTNIGAQEDCATISNDEMDSVLGN